MKKLTMRKKCDKSLTIIVSIVFLAVVIFTLNRPTPVFAATSPDLGGNSSYGIISSTYTNSLNAALETAIHGDICYTTGPGTTPVSIVGATVVPCADARGTDQSSALADLNAQADSSCNDLGVNVVLSGTYTPGCYSSSGTMDITLGTTITLDGAGTYIFRSGGAFTTGADSVVALANGASAADVFWVPNGQAVIGANSSTSATPTFVGNIIQNSGAAFDVTIGHFVNLLGRVIAFGRTVTTDSVTITIPDDATLHVIKQVTNDNGGTAVASDFTLHVKLSGTDVVGSPLAGTASPGTSYALSAGTYVVSEDVNAQYTATIGGDCATDGTIALVAGQNKTCTITNNDNAPSLHLRKTVTNDNAGTALNTAWTLTATGAGGSPTNLTGTTPVDSGATFKADTYTLAESGGPVGYTAGSWVCVGGAQVGANVTLALGESATCTINNNDIAPATLHVVKTVINDNGGTAVASDFTLNVTGTNVSQSSFAGSATGVDVTLDAGSYSVTEPIVPAGYLQTGSGACSGTIAAGETKTCTITNDDIAPQLIVNKVVVNDNGRTKVISNFPLFIDGVSVTSGVASTTTIGLHTISETADSNYTSVIGGNCAANGTITLALGDVKTCTITNDDIAPVVSPIVLTPSAGGTYYAPVPPLIDLVKVPAPLALPNGAGTVKYTYTLSNTGTVPVTDITMVGDTCSPIILVSGDTNSDSSLDVDETWIYTCSATLTKTHTNIVTAIGWANGISATDIANATVIVGIPVVPPLIHVTKIPNSLALSAEGGMVTYTNKVTNPGTVALSNVELTDDKCSPVKYISGDTNGDSKLDTTETWVYTCQTKLINTTVNTVTASGEANGLTAKDFAIATVVLSPANTVNADNAVNVANPAVPKLPNTGLSSDENNTPWNIIVPAGIFAILTLFYFARRKKTA